MMSKRKKSSRDTRGQGFVRLFSISCRSVGPGGTSVDFYAYAGGVKAIWRNENCPYGPSDNLGAALDGHNVSEIAWRELAESVSIAKLKRWVRG